MRQPEQQLLGIARPDPGKPSKWRGPRELPFVARRREAAHERRKARIWANVQLPKLGRMP